MVFIHYFVCSATWRVSFVRNNILHCNCNKETGSNKVKNIKKKYHAVGTVPKSSRIIIETESKSIPPTHKYMTAYFPDLAFEWTQTLFDINVAKISKSIYNHKINAVHIVHICAHYHIVSMQY